MRWPFKRQGSLTWRRAAIFGVVTLCLCVLIIVVPLWTGVSPYVVFVIAWAVLLVLLVVLPKRT